MRKYRIMPPIQYNLEAVDAWMSKKGEKGLRLTQIFGPIVEFEKYEGPKIHYRARYVRDNRQINGALYWGNLYVYQSTDPNELPERGPDDGRLAKKAAFKHSLLALLLMGLDVGLHIDRLLHSFWSSTGEQMVSSLLIVSLFLYLLVRTLRIFSKI